MVSIMTLLGSADCCASPDVRVAAPPSGGQTVQERCLLFASITLLILRMRACDTHEHVHDRHENRLNQTRHALLAAVKT